jgi:hypothetical protein
VCRRDEAERALVDSDEHHVESGSAACPGTKRCLLHFMGCDGAVLEQPIRRLRPSKTCVTRPLGRANTPAAISTSRAVRRASPSAASPNVEEAHASWLLFTFEIRGLGAEM